MLRVADLDKAIEFYTTILGMKLLRKSDNADYKYTLAFIGYGDESDTTVLELTWNWETDTYDMGNAFGHIALEVDDIYQVCDDISKQGISIKRAPGPVKGGTTVIAFINDPDGYSIELIQKKT